ncbi:MAG: hypothetical protein ABFD96_06005 [Armatimonadia bacterium]
MATEANQPQTPDLPPDLPVESVTSDDGGNTQPSYTPPQTPPAKQEQAEERQEAQPWKDERRAEIFARAREKRQAETEPFSGDPNDPAALYGTQVEQDDLGDLEKAALQRRKDYLAEMAGQQPEGQQQQQQPARKTLNGLDPELLARTATIIVDGQPREITVEEALRNYQIEEAAKRRLEDAKALLRHTSEFQRVQQPQPGSQRTEDTEPSEQDNPASDQGDMDQGRGNTVRRPANAGELIEKIQLGSRDEAIEAIEEFISAAVNRPPPVDETTRVLTALEDANAEKAIRAFAEQNPQIATHPAVQSVATMEIHKGMAEDLLRAGYSMDDLRQAAPNAQALAQLHKQARIKGLKGVRSVTDLVSAGYQGAISNLRSLVDQAAPRNPANPPANMQQRQQRKETLQPQPAARRLSPAMTAPSKPRTEQQSRSDAVARMRQSRGQPT